MSTKLIDPMEEVRQWKRKLSRELNEAARKGRLWQKLKEIERRTEKAVRYIKRAKTSK